MRPMVSSESVSFKLLCCDPDRGSYAPAEEIQSHGDFYGVYSSYYRNPLVFVFIVVSRWVECASRRSVGWISSAVVGKILARI